MDIIGEDQQTVADNEMRTSVGTVDSGGRP